MDHGSPRHAKSLRQVIVDGVATGLATAFLVWQAGMMVGVRFVDTRYFSWAPHDAQHEYRISATVDGDRLSETEIEARYRIPAEGIDPRAIAHVQRLVEQYETTRADEPATVRIEWRKNGGPLRTWTYPR